MKTLDPPQLDTPSLRPSRDLAITPLRRIEVNGLNFDISALPPMLTHRPDLGIVHHANFEAQRIHIDRFTCHPCAIRTLDGEYLLLFPAGPKHYGWANGDLHSNRMLAFRSADRGRTWHSQGLAWDAGYNQHAAILHASPDRQTLYVFGTEPRPDLYDGIENAAIGWRTSHDQGRTWSDVRLIQPVNAPDFQGMSAMRMCETPRGTWLIGAHAREAKDSPVRTQQFILRSEDRGETWMLLPGPWPHGWAAPGYHRMDEGRPIALGGDRVMIMARTPTGYLWEIRSEDDGKTWSEPKPTPLRHPDAPPMLFHLSDNRTLAAFHHNRAAGGDWGHAHRVELWVSLSEDEGATWSEPRFVLANACEPAILEGWGGSTPMVSYADLLVDAGELHLFIDHQMRQVLHVRFHERDLASLPTRDELRAMIG